MGSRKKGRLEKQKPCARLRDADQSGDQRPAILPWFSDFGWRPSFRVIRAPCPLCPAAGLPLDWSVGMNASAEPRLSDHAPDANLHWPAPDVRFSLDQKPLNKRFRS